MFDKITFAKIINQIKEMYPTQEEFCKKSGIGRTSISQYMNAKLQAPPKPKMLEKLASASFGSISYNELMVVCGYTRPAVNAYIDFANDKEKKILNSLVLYAHDNNISANNLLNDKESLKYLEGLSEVEKKTLINIVTEILTNSDYKNLKNAIISDKLDKLGNPVTPIPVLGTVKAGYDYLAEENWEGTVNVKSEFIEDSSEYFALKIKRKQHVPYLTRGRHSPCKKTK